MSARRATALTLFLALLAPSVLAQEPAPAPRTEDRNKALVQRYIDEVLSGGDLSKVEAYVADSYSDATPGAESDARGPQVVKAAVERARSAFRNVRYTVDELIAEGDAVLARYTVTTVFKSDDRKVSITGMTIFRVAGDRIYEAWTINDQLAMFRQLGYTLTPPGSAAPEAEPPAPGEP